MPAIPQEVINDLKELILDHIRQTADAEGDQGPGGGLGGDVEDKLRGLDVEIDAIEETITSLQTGLRTWITQRKTQRNSLIRFNRLPLEISSKILWLAVADPWQREISFSFLRRLETISSVCSSWRALIEGSPRFWSIIEFSNPETVILNFLRKSRSNSLEIKCFSDGIYDCTPPTELVSNVEWRCLKLIAPHMDRIQSLIYSAYSADGLLPILGNPAPILEELRLELMDNFLEVPLDLFCGQAGRLRDVALWNISIRWDSVILAGLRSLKIKGEFVCSPTEGQVWRLLQANPGLETMEIEDVMVTERFADDAVESSREGKSSRMVMSKLQQLRLLSLPFELVQAVLNNAETPYIKHFDVNCFFQEQLASESLGPTMKHLASPLLRLSQGAHLAEIAFGEITVGLKIYVGRQDPTIRIELQNTTPVREFGRLAEIFFHTEGLPLVCAAEVFQVSLKFWSNFDLAGGAFIPILDRLGAVKVKALTIESTCRNGGELIDYLGELNEDSQWPLPHLTSWTIGGRTELADHLLRVLQRRKEAPPEGAVNPLRPVLLEVLDLRALEVSARADMDEVLAKCISSTGTFTQATVRPFRYPAAFGDGWDDFDDDDEEEEIDYNYEPSVLW
ncbi:hypothetical protein FRC01_006717 [Tulasnella sp. 417]|nr:hypothetical protein FRC01_006717 [Tulasnella sp. 417]